MTIINEKLDPNGAKTITGTLDVSTSNKNKVSRYLPFEETFPSSTDPQTTTAPVEYGSNYEWSQDTTIDNGYTDDTSSYDNSGLGDTSEYVW